jgi:hypothetical protein
MLNTRGDVLFNRRFLEKLCHLMILRLIDEYNRAFSLYYIPPEDGSLPILEWEVSSLKGYLAFLNNTWNFIFGIFSRRVGLSD